MAAANRANVFTACQKFVKKHYTSAGPDKRPILEQMVFAAILENAPRKVADDAFAALEKEYFDWNEVRVTSIAELKELLAKHPTSEATANRVKTLLQNVFEAIYGYDLETLKKGNQGKAVAQIEKYGATPFVLGYVTQHALGGHAIPVDKALLNLMFVLGAVTDKEAEKGTVPGIERAIPKTKGVEFSDMIHELAVDFQASPFSKKIRDIILDIAPDAKTRFPRRVADTSTPAAEPAEKQVEEKSSAKAKPNKKASTKAEPIKTAKAAPQKKTTKETPAKEATSKKTPTKSKTPQKSGGTKKASPAKGSTGLSKKKPK